MTDSERVFFVCQSNYLEVSRAALRRNAAAVRDAVQVPVIAILKCDGYGVSICEAAAAWQAEGITMFGVSRPEEALELRQAGFDETILLLCPVVDVQTLEEMLENNVILSVSSLENARFYSENAADRTIRVHVAIDTGLGRFGIRWTDAEQAKAVYALPGLAIEGIFSHFSSSFEPEFAVTKTQLSRFLSMTQALQEAGASIGIRHIANSCAALRFPETRLDAVRVGAALIGRLPAPTPVKLENIGVFKAKVVECKHFEPGDTTGYGCYCKIKKPTDAIVVALGQMDGFGVISRPDKLRLVDFASALSHIVRGWIHPACVKYNGRRMPLLGRFGSQYTLFDATGVEIKPGEYVEWEGNLLTASCEKRFVE